MKRKQYRIILCLASLILLLAMDRCISFLSGSASGESVDNQAGFLFIPFLRLLVVGIGSAKTILLLVWSGCVQRKGAASDFRPSQSGCLIRIIRAVLVSKIVVLGLGILISILRPSDENRVVSVLFGCAMIRICLNFLQLCVN